MESQQNIKIFITDLSYSNISFERGGSLLEFNQQLANYIILDNLQVVNIYQGYISIEAANKSRLTRKTKVQIQNSKFDTINAGFFSLLILNEGALLNIMNSTFNQVSSLEEGAIIFADYQETETNIYSSSFTNNTSVKGSLFNIKDSSVVRCYNCQMVANFAIISGLVYVSDDGFFEFYG